jgi:hypothetical protein
LSGPYLPGIDAGLIQYGKRFHDKTLGALSRLTAPAVSAGLLANGMG